MARILLRRFHTIKSIALADLAGGECTDGGKPSLDIDLLVVAESPAEAYALKSLGDIIDNAIREAFIYTKSRDEYKRLAEAYGRGLHHNLLELHVNDHYARANLISCPPIRLYPPTN